MPDLHSRGTFPSLTSVRPVSLNDRFTELLGEWYSGNGALPSCSVEIELKEIVQAFNSGRRTSDSSAAISVVTTLAILRTTEGRDVDNTTQLRGDLDHMESLLKNMKQA